VTLYAVWRASNVTVYDYTYDAANQLTAETKTQGGAVETFKYYYDANGAQTRKTRMDGSAETNLETRAYDIFGRLTSETSGGVTATYAYQADSLRLSKTVSGVKTTHVWDGGQMVAELNAANAVTARYIRGAGGRIVSSLDASGAARYYIYNGHGDVAGLTDASGALAKTYRYDAFGNEVSPVATDTNPFRYAGQYYDLETNTYYNQARYYNPTTGRFLSEDSFRGYLDNPLSLNLYTYCGNNPVRYYDPDGHFWKEIGDGLKWAGGKIYDGASVAASAVLHGGDRVACNVFGIDTAAAGALVLSMYKDSNGIYHATTDAWQQIGGYNSIYDAVFDFGTSMKAQYYGFSYGGQNYRFWAWKGDYINLGAGAELGIYQKSSIPGHWDVNTSLALPMSMTLKDNKGNLLASYSPSDPQWWITSFNPSDKNVNANNLQVSFTVNFSGNKDIFDAFYKTWGNQKDTPWTFDKKNYTATLNF
jgi:RHS repeat-associated protein